MSAPSPTRFTPGWRRDSKTDNQKAAGLFGLAKRAGAVVTGFDAALAATEKRRAKGVFFACDLSPKTVKEWAFKTQDRPPVPCVTALTKDELGQALGARGPVGIVAVCDEGFADAIRVHCPTMKEEKQ